MTNRTVAALFAIEAAVFALLVFALTDRAAHRRDPDRVNQWGYRGEPRAKKDPGEIRIALVGGSAAFEGDRVVSDTLASQISFVLQEKWAPHDQFHSVVNISEPRVAADSYATAIDHYDFLDPDILCLFDGYDTVAGLPPHARERSLIFRATGYLPLLPQRLLHQPEWLSDPDGGIADVLRDTDRSGDMSCAGASSAYCAAMADAVNTGLSLGRIVIVALPPRVSARHAAQQESLGDTLQRQFGGNPRFALIDTASAIDLSRNEHSPDGVHRTVLADHEVAQRIGLFVVTLLGQPPRLP